MKVPFYIKTKDKVSGNMWKEETNRVFKITEVKGEQLWYGKSSQEFVCKNDVLYYMKELTRLGKL